MILFSTPYEFYCILARWKIQNSFNFSVHFNDQFFFVPICVLFRENSMGCLKEYVLCKFWVKYPIDMLGLFVYFVRQYNNDACLFSVHICFKCLFSHLFTLRWFLSMVFLIDNGSTNAVSLSIQTTPALFDLVKVVSSPQLWFPEQHTSVFCQPFEIIWAVDGC